MKRWIIAIVVMLLAVQSLAQDKDKEKDKDSGSRLVYADFEQLKDGRPVSARGGAVLLSGYQESPTNVVSYTNSDKPDHLPSVVPAAQNHSQLIFFNYNIPNPNQWGGVTLEIRGLPDQDGKQTAEDLSAYKYLTVQVAAQGTTSLKAELISKDNGVKIPDGQNHGFVFKLSPNPGLNTYRLALKQFSQPTWDTVTKADVKDVLKKLTAIHIVSQTVPSKGQVVVDNVSFEK